MSKLDDLEYRWDLTSAEPDDELIADLATWFGIPEDACRQRIDSYRMTELAEAWNAANPRSAGQIRQFYGSTDPCIWEQAKWHSTPSYAAYLRNADYIIEKYPVKDYPRVIDFGCGIATASIKMARAGYLLTLADVPGKTLDFAAHRFARRNLSCDIISVSRRMPRIRGVFDIAICFDVMEHIPDPEFSIFALAGALRTGGVATIIADFANYGLHPQHLQANIDQFNNSSWSELLKTAGLVMNQDLLLEKHEVRSMLARKIRWFRAKLQNRFA